MKKLVLLTFCCLLPGSAAFAGSVPVTLAQLDSFTLLDSDPSATLDVTKSTDFGTPFTDYEVDFANVTTANAFADVGLSGLSEDWTSFDSFELMVTNSNESTWGFNIFFVDADGTRFESSVVMLDVGDSAVLSIDFTGLGANLDGVMAFGITVSGSLPRDGETDTTAEFRAKPVPEPSSLLLLGAGLTALGLLRRRLS